MGVVAGYLVGGLVVFRVWAMLSPASILGSAQTVAPRLGQKSAHVGTLVFFLFRADCVKGAGRRDLRVLCRRL